MTNDVPPFRRIAISRLVPEDSLAPQPDPPTLHGQALEWAEYACSEGADALMIREHSLQMPVLQDLLARLRERFPAGRCRLLLNHGLVDAKLPVDGFHTQSDAVLPPAAFPQRRFALGKSVHDLSAALTAARQRFDYLLFSPVYASATHPDRPAQGLARLREICEAVSVPVYALGGIGPAEEAACREAGAAGVAAIGWFQGPTGQA
jgi:thiamine monophosphate synthase